MPVSVGSKLGPYEILAPIGAGGMGEVYRARDTRLKRDVAIKVLPDAATPPTRAAVLERYRAVLPSVPEHPLFGLVTQITIAARPVAKPSRSVAENDRRRFPHKIHRTRVRSRRHPRGRIFASIARRRRTKPSASAFTRHSWFARTAARNGRSNKDARVVLASAGYRIRGPGISRDAGLAEVGRDREAPRSSRKGPFLIRAATGQERTSGYWSHRQCGAQIVSDPVCAGTSAQAKF
jgi:hypothetical protein